MNCNGACSGCTAHGAVQNYDCPHCRECVDHVSLTGMTQGFAGGDYPFQSTIKGQKTPENEMLIPVAPPYTLTEVPLDNIICDFEIAETSFKGLARSINRLGVVQPVILKEVDNGKFRVYAGKRRVLGAKRKNGVTHIPALVFPKAAPDSLLSIFAIAENMNRGPNPADEAEKIQKVMSYYNWTVENAAKELFMPAGHIRQRLKLTHLIPELFERLRKGELRGSMALKIAALPEAHQKDLLKEKRRISSELVERGPHLLPD